MLISTSNYEFLLHIDNVILVKNSTTEHTSHVFLRKYIFHSRNKLSHLARKPLFRVENLALFNY